MNKKAAVEKHAFHSLVKRKISISNNLFSSKYCNKRYNIKKLFILGKVLVHCEMGISRSSTFVIAYLMWKEKMNLIEAVKKVIKKFY